METIEPGKHSDSALPSPKNNRSFQPSCCINTLVLMQDEESSRLEDVRHIHDDMALRTWVNPEAIPQPGSPGNGLRKMGASCIDQSWREANEVILKSALHNCKAVTLDIDATGITANKAGAKWTCGNNKGYMPMVGHISETGQTAACDFREGNTAPAKQNLEFIPQSQDALPSKCSVKRLRIDAAGYQENIIKYCDENTIDYATRAVKSSAVAQIIESLDESDWQPFIDKNGNSVEAQQTARTTHCTGDYERAFSLLTQRTRVGGSAHWIRAMINRVPGWN